MRREIEKYRDAHYWQTAAILGTGPSLEDHDLALFSGVLFGVNGSWKRTTNVDYWVAQDLDDLEALGRGEWKMGRRIPNRSKLTAAFVLHRQENDRALELWPPTILVPRRTGRVGHRFSSKRVFSTDLSGEGAHDHNSGLLALQLAVWMGCYPIWLLGFDCRGGHFYDKDVPSITPHAAIAKTIDQAAKALTPGRVLNANPRSAVRGFEFRDFGATFGRRTA